MYCKYGRERERERERERDRDRETETEYIQSTEWVHPSQIAPEAELLTSYTEGLLSSE